MDGPSLGGVMVLFCRADVGGLGFSFTADCRVRVR